MRLVVDLYGAGLERVLEIVHERGALDRRGARRARRRRSGRQPAARARPAPLRRDDRVERALEGVRPYLGSHGGDVELLGVDRRRGRPAAAAGQLRRLPVVRGDRRRSRRRSRRPRRRSPASSRGAGRRRDPRPVGPVRGGSPTPRRAPADDMTSAGRPGVPLAALRRVTRSRPAPPPASAATCAPRRSRTSTRTWSTCTAAR